MFKFKTKVQSFFCLWTETWFNAFTVTQGGNPPLSYNAFEEVLAESNRLKA